MKIVMISGSFPPVKCGIGDYSYNLVSCLVGSGWDVDVSAFNSSEEPPEDGFKNIQIKSWSIFSVLNIFSVLKKQRPDIVHLQYPSVSYGRNLAPQLLTILLKLARYKVVVTLHEFSQSHFLRKLADLPLIFFSDVLIFTNSYERRKVSFFSQWVASKSEVINVGSNIKLENQNLLLKKEKNLVIFFGLIRPDKGLEEYIELAILAAGKKKPYKFMIIGSPQKEGASYYEKMMKLSSGMNNLEWKVGLKEDEVSKELARASFAYLFYPDGASERRTSLLACLEHRIAVISNKGKQTPEEFNGVLEFAPSPEDALEKIDILSADTLALSHILDNSNRYVQKCSWSRIASEHMRVYNSLLDK